MWLCNYVKWVYFGDYVIMSSGYIDDFVIMSGGWYVIMIMGCHLGDYGLMVAWHRVPATRKCVDYYVMFNIWVGLGLYVRPFPVYPLIHSTLDTKRNTDSHKRKS